MLDMVRFSNYRRLVNIILLYVVGIAFLVLTNPNSLPLIVLMVPLVVFFLALMFTAKALMDYFSKEDNNATSRRKRLALSAIFAGFPMACFLLLSVGQFSGWDFIVLLILFSLLVFYINRMGSHNS